KRILSLAEELCLKREDAASADRELGNLGAVAVDCCRRARSVGRRVGSTVQDVNEPAAACQNSASGKGAARGYRRPVYPHEISCVVIDFEGADDALAVSGCGSSGDKKKADGITLNARRNA